MTIHRVFVRLAEGEWGNETMDRAAHETAKQYPQRPLVVTVNEHAGWHLSYLFGATGIPDGSICGTANDAASLDSKVLDFGKSVTDEVHLGTIRHAA